jgi:Fe-S cluster assembly ATP-binding protein
MKKNSSLIIITHNPKILTYLKPTYIHIMREGKIIKTGNEELILQLENEGYQNF